MKKLVVLLCLGVIVNAKPSHPHAYSDVYPIHPGVGAIYKGPNSETIIEGPDGSVITSEADGGAVALKGDAVVPVPVVKHVGPPVVTSHHAISSATYEAKTISHSPIVVEEPVILQEIVPQAVLVADTRDTATLEGPSGSIVRHGEDAIVSGPSSTTIRDGKLVVSIPNVELQTTVVEPYPNRPALIDNSHRRVAPPIVVSTPAPDLYAVDHRSQHDVGAYHQVRVTPQVVVSTPATGLHGLIQNDVGVVHNEVYVSSTPGPIVHQTPVTLGHAPVEVVSPAVVAYPDVSLSPPLVHSTPVYQGGLTHANQAALANKASVEQSYLSAAQYAEYEKAVQVENERRAFEAHVAHSGHHAGHGLVQQQQLTPVISQGNQVISGHVVSSTVSPILVNSLSPVTPSIHSTNAINELVSVGPQVFQNNAIVSSTVQPEVIVTPIPSVVSSTVQQGYLARVAPTENVVIASSTPNEILNYEPIISYPKAVLSPVRAAVSPGQLLVQSNSVSERHESSHSSSSVQHSSSTGVISAPVDGHVVVGGHGPHGVEYGPHPGLSGIAPSDLAQWQHSLADHGHARPGRVRPLHRGRYYH